MYELMHVPRKICIALCSEKCRFLICNPQEENATFCDCRLLTITTKLFVFGDSIRAPTHKPVNMDEDSSETQIRHIKDVKEVF